MTPYARPVDNVGRRDLDQVSPDDVARVVAGRLSDDDAAEALLARSRRPELFVAFGPAGGAPVGVAFGVAVADEAILQGIAVEASWAGRGIGSRLLGAFEEACGRAGLRSVSLGSAGGYVEHFYRKNGYRVREHLVTVDTADVRIPEGIAVRRVRRQAAGICLNVVVTGVDPGSAADYLRAALATDRVSVVFEKLLPT